MDAFWSSLLFSAKWLFIGLTYLFLVVVLLAVRREMQGRLTGEARAPAAAAGRLKIINPGSDAQMRPGEILALSNETSLGADQGNDLVLTDHFISSRHARLRWDGAKWWLLDLDSKNGTFVNGRQVPAYREQPVPFGATLRLGDMAFELVE